MKLLILLVGGTLLGFAPNLNPVHWSLFVSSPTMLRLHADIDAGYHLYSLTTPKGGPIRTKIRVVESGFVTLGEVGQPKPDVKRDVTFEVDVETFSGSVDFVVPLEWRKPVGASGQRVSVISRYQACSDVICLPPVERTLSVIVPRR